MSDVGVDALSTLSAHLVLDQSDRCSVCLVDRGYRYHALLSLQSFVIYSIKPKLLRYRKCTNLFQNLSHIPLQAREPRRVTQKSIVGPSAAIEYDSGLMKAGQAATE